MPSLENIFTFTCPFARGGEVRPLRARVSCEQYEEATIFLYFGEREPMDAFVARYCAGDFTKCMIYRAVMRDKYHEEPWESFRPKEDD